METKIIESKSFLAFAKQYGPTVKVASWVNSNTGDSFKSLAFINNEDKMTLVGFSQNLGELTPAQLVKMATTLQVVKLDTGHYYLCKQGGKMEDVDLSSLLAMG